MAIDRSRVLGDGPYGADYYWADAAIGGIIGDSCVSAGSNNQWGRPILQCIKGDGYYGRVPEPIEYVTEHLQAPATTTPPSLNTPAPIDAKTIIVLLFVFIFFSALS